MGMVQMTSKCLVCISRGMERIFWRNNRFGEEVVNSELDMISLRRLGHLKTSGRLWSLGGHLGCRHKLRSAPWVGTEGELKPQEGGIAQRLRRTNFNRQTDL